MVNKVAIIEKIQRINDFYIERMLPDVGTFLVEMGDLVQPFTKIGEAKVSYYFQKIDPSYKLIRHNDEFIEKGVEIARDYSKPFRARRVFAPYDGFIRSVGNNINIFEQEKERFQLFSGAYGSVQDMVENKSVLIKGSAHVISCAFSTPFEIEGELVVLPNPSELLEDPYFTNFTKEVAGKIIYTGYSVKLENVKRAISLGVSGIIAGGLDKGTYEYASENNFLAASLSGFGRIPTPKQIYALLESVGNRYVFLRGQTGELVIPAGERFGDKDVSVRPKDKAHTEKDLFVEISKDLTVQVLERPYFGWVGKVKAADGDQVIVILDEGPEVKVKSTNLIALKF